MIIKEVRFIALSVVEVEAKLRDAFCILAKGGQQPAKILQ
jgi:hypothetical protein